MTDDLNPDLQARIDALTAKVTIADLFDQTLSVLYELGDLGTVLDNLEDINFPQKPPAENVALFRLFSKDIPRTEPTLVEAPSDRIRSRLSFGDKTYQLRGATDPLYYDLSVYAHAWDFIEEETPGSLLPRWEGPQLR